jgi:hypothetical protein
MTDSTNSAQDPLATLLSQHLASAPASSRSPPPSTRPGGGESGYDPLYPIASTSNEDEESVRQFISRFFEISDDPARDEEWVGSFTEGAVLFMGDKVARGTEGQSNHNTRL